jgi:hypothetical protein
MQPFIQPYGIADLLVVKQALVGYRKADFAAVQEVMATEVREQKTRRPSHRSSRSRATAADKAEVYRELGLQLP